MNTVTQAIMWDGVYANLCMYIVVSNRDALLNIDFSRCSSDLLNTPRGFKLDRECEADRNNIYMFDIRLSTIPDNLEEYLICCLNESINAGSFCSWFAFDGGFSLDNLMNEFDYSSIYALETSKLSAKIALDDNFRSSSQWLEIVKSVGSNVL